MIMSVIRFKNNTLYASEFITQPGINKVRFTHDGKVICNGYITQDLRMPANATFTRPTPAYLSDGTQVAANVPRFEQGKFGKAVMVEEGTENIIPIADWNAQNGWALAWGTQTRTIETTGLLFNGVNIIKSVIESTGQAVILKDFAVSTTPGVVYTISAFVKSQGRPVRIWCHDRLDNGQVYSSSNVPGTDFTRLTVNFTTTGTGYCRVHFLFLPGNVGDIVWVTAPQLEQKPYATSFIDGTRSAESLTIPMAGVLNPQEGTVEFWVKPLVVADWNNFFYIQTSNGRFLLFFYTDGRAAFDYGPNDTGPVAPAGTIQADDWHHIVLRWSAATNKHALFVNGVKYEQDLPAGVAESFPATASVVINYSAFIDDLRISSRARSDAEILAEYQSGQPAQWDEWTTYKADFDEKIRFTHDGKVVCEKFALV
jgi:hypothetical protein